MSESFPCGVWKSPISADSLAGQSILRDLDWGPNGELIWQIESDGHGVLKNDSPVSGLSALTESISVEGGVGYGGGAFTVRREDVVFAGEDGRLYHTKLGQSGTPEPITPAFGASASPAIAPGGQWVAYTHTYNEEDSIGLAKLSGHGWPQQWITGSDFYMYPRWGPEGRRFVWMEWDHPNMPWDGSRIKMATLDETKDTVRLGDIELVAGGEQESVIQPEFSPDGKKLAFISDRDGWWHLYLRDLESGETRQLSSGAYEVGGPSWVQGLRYYDWGGSGEKIYALRNREGRYSVACYSLEGDVSEIQSFREYSSMGQISVSPEDDIAVLASSSRIPARLVVGGENREATVRCRTSAELFESSSLSKAKKVSWTSEDSEISDVYGFYYPPAGVDVSALDELPPAIVMIHGGPSSQRTAAFEEEHQFFTTRGFAVLDVNYRGSTGYGRAYRDALKGNWGITDVEDAVGGVDFLAKNELADPDRIAIMGGSAGGFTVYRALIEHPGLFAAGIAKYAVSNLFELTLDTHKFEERYTESLVGQLPEDREIYRERSPLFHAEKIEDPIAIFQGAEDKVVPKPQADQIVEKLKASGVPHLYRVYDDEGHGWRLSENIEDFYNSTLSFLKEHVVFS